VKSAASLLTTSLHEIEEDAVIFIRGMDVARGGTQRHSHVVLVQPDYWWAATSPAQRHQQMVVRERFLHAHERLQLLLSTASPSVQNQLTKGKKAVLHWIDLETNWSLSPDKERSESQLREVFKPLHRCIDILHHGASPDIIVVPDTNALTFNPDPRCYEPIAESREFTFALVPMVLTELDRLKTEARNEEFRKKVASAIRRIKGWRAQGSLITGVTVDQTIRLIAVPHEPDFSATLSWLQRDNNDDRIIASILELQRRNPSSVVILVTGDLNLQNKAEAAGIPWSELPEAT
jgi:rRNA-processing protein FCF1